MLASDAQSTAVTNAAPSCRYPGHLHDMHVSHCPVYAIPFVQVTMVLKSVVGRKHLLMSHMFCQDVTSGSSLDLFFCHL